MRRDVNASAIRPVTFIYFLPPFCISLFRTYGYAAVITKIGGFVIKLLIY